MRKTQRPGKAAKGPKQGKDKQVRRPSRNGNGSIVAAGGTRKSLPSTARSGTKRTKKKLARPKNGSRYIHKRFPNVVPVRVPEVLERYRKLLHQALIGPHPDRIEAQHDKGKLTARERISRLLDAGSFNEMGLLQKTRATDFGLQEKALHGDGVITGFGTIDGRTVALYAQDFTMLGGTIGLTHAQKISRLMDLALEARVPCIGLLDSGGARIQEGVDALDGYARIFNSNVRSSGRIPQISVILGPCAGGAVYSPALTDFVFMVKGISYMFITGPKVVKAATGEDVDSATLGGSEIHGSKSGLCHFISNSEADCFRRVRDLLSFLPKSRWDVLSPLSTNDPPDRETRELNTLLELDPRTPYDMRHCIWQIADDGKFLAVHQDFAKSVITGFMRLGGRAVGIVANNPGENAGALDIDSSEKAARFIRFLNNFNIPLLTLVDVPGYWPGVKQEHGGIIRRGAKLLYAYAEATIPKVTIVMRKAYGGAYIAMGSKHLNGDINYAFPSAEIAVMGPRGAVGILHRREIQESPEPDKLAEKLALEYAERFASPYQTAGSGSVDEVIEPLQTRQKLIHAFNVLRDKRRPGEREATGNMPL